MQDSQVATIDRVTFEPESWGPPGPVRVGRDAGRWQRGRGLPLLLRRASLSPDDLVGRTVEEARKLHGARDSTWLSS